MLTKLEEIFPFFLTICVLSYINCNHFENNINVILCVTFLFAFAS